MSKEQKKDWQKIKEESEIETLAEEALSPSLEHPDYSELEEKLTLAEQEGSKYKEEAIRAKAELDNARKRYEREIEKAYLFGAEKLITDILPVVDSIEQALVLLQKAENKDMEEGLALTMKLFTDVLEKAGVSQINPKGENFDPLQHEAMSAVPSELHPENTVLDVFQKGYMLSNRVIRPARVIVSKKI